MGTLIATVLVVLIGSGLCSGSETALLSVPEIRAQQLATSQGRRGRALLAIKQHIARPISAIASSTTSSTSWAASRSVWSPRPPSGNGPLASSPAS